MGPILPVVCLFASFIASQVLFKYSLFLDNMILRWHFIHDGSRTQYKVTLWENRFGSVHTNMEVKVSTDYCPISKTKPKPNIIQEKQTLTFNYFKEIVFPHFKMFIK